MHGEDKKEQEGIRLLQKSLEEWQEKGYLNNEQKEALEDSLEPTTFNWQDLSLSAFVFAIGCSFIAIIALFADRWLMQALNQFVETSDFIKSFVLALLALVLYLLGWRRQQKKSSNTTYSNETFYTLASFAAAMAIGFLGIALGGGRGTLTAMLGLAAVLYMSLALFLNSRLNWLFGILALAACFGAATAKGTDYQAYYKGMNYPLRFIIFGTLLTLCSYLLTLHSRTRIFSKMTRIVGISSLLFCLWLMSIFGNMVRYDLWEQVSQSHFLGWSLLLMICAALTTWWGHRSGQLTIRDLGITFFILNLYTRYIEYCWTIMPKALFFSLMALSFWLVGKQAEKFWQSEKKEQTGI
ncbi:hypothetical protein [Nafulsella turpanensis]|uniref:hypothetical protein n=1 Tax=Nafulsella turpanensis TaxID=1265690 RepID=UPI00034B6C07|nr:hypothetical protein [Nafulsella turpanensis]